MTEELAFKKRFRDGTGIYSHHGLSATQAVRMDFLCQHILSGTVLTRDEHGGIGRSYLGDGSLDGLHGRTGAPEHGGRRRSCGTLLGTGIPVQSLPCLVPCSTQHLHQFLVVPRLYDEVECSPFHPFHSQLDIGIGCEEHHLHIGSHLLQLRSPVQTLVARIDGRVEIHIQQHHIRTELFQSPDEGGR